MKTVLVTGASSGIGRAIALRLLNEGHHVVATSRSLEKLHCTFDREILNNLNVKLLKMDVSDSKDIELTFRRLAIDNIAIDALVNNAGYGLTGLLATISSDELLQQFQTNAFGLMEVTRNVLPYMKEKNAGKIINIGSVLGRLSVPWNGAYSASKFALEGLSESLRYELHGSGVFVSIVEPGLFDTKFRDNQIESISPVSEALFWQNNYLKTVRRRGSNPDKVAHLVSKILNQRRPRLRYVVGWDAKAAIFLRSILPSRTFEYFVCKFTGRL